MKPTLLIALAIAFSPALVCLVGAVVLAASGSGGWGWFLFVGLILGGGVSVKGIPTK